MTWTVAVLAPEPKSTDTMTTFLSSFYKNLKFFSFKPTTPTGFKKSNLKDNNTFPLDPFIKQNVTTRCIWAHESA